MLGTVTSDTRLPFGSKIVIRFRSRSTTPTVPSGPRVKIGWLDELARPLAFPAENTCRRVARARAVDADVVG